MKKISLLLLMVLAISLGVSPAHARDGLTFDDRVAGTHDPGERKADNGETVYRCATDERGRRPVISQETIDRWIQENRIVAGGNIPVYVHVIRKSQRGQLIGDVSDADIAEQIAVLNNNFSGRDYDGNVVSGAANTGYSFTLVQVTRTTNSKWFGMTPGSRNERDAKNALSINPGGALNIFLCGPGQNLLGWAVFPWTSAAGTSQDGVVIHYASLPNGSLAPYNLGGTATHEVGHYLGLLHTFQGGCDTGSCSATGDQVCDTPAEQTATSGCPSGKDTCPAPGADPIHNYMDYSTDICYTNFTAGQDTRMNAYVTQYRGWIGATRVANDEGGPGGILDEPDPIGTRFDLAEFGERKTHNDETVYRCATDERGPKVRIPTEQIERWIRENRIVAGGVIPVHFNVIYKTQGGTVGNVPDSWINAQIQVMNWHFAGRDYNGNPVAGAANTGYTFTLASIERVNNRKWFGMTPGSSAEVQAKNAMANSPGSALNIYTCSPGQNLLGWAVFPWTSAAGTNQDGVVVHYNSLPGGTLAPYNLGGTATHEVGHYLGLYHTFQGGCHSDGTCSTAGDQVCDTPAQASPTSGCPAGRNSCTQTGLDPIHNYMDYSSDACYTNFTPGQDTRMNSMVTQYRAWIGATRVANGAGSIEAARELGAGVVEFHARPNPFNPRTKVEFGIRKDAMVSLQVYDVHGRLAATLVNRRMNAGDHAVDFDATRLASGVYQMVLRVEGEKALVRRVTLLK
ncbi:MAG TPA: zinc metalloprotease [Candidatus Eisenbacteria bacterium]|nr:zinc metalloprotease [Candidatus Eisenbacteria bacterium]